LPVGKIAVGAIVIKKPGVAAGRLRLFGRSAVLALLATARAATPFAARLTTLLSPALLSTLLTLLAIALLTVALSALILLAALARILILVCHTQFSLTLCEEERPTQTAVPVLPLHICAASNL